MMNLLSELVSRGASQEYIRVISVVVAPPALTLISKEYTGKDSHRLQDPAIRSSCMLVVMMGA